jgi:hypothetical protein
MIEGKLIAENYRGRRNRPENQQVVGIDCPAGATRIEMKQLGTELCAPGGPLNTVDKKQTIHASGISPIGTNAPSACTCTAADDSCVVFDIEGQRCFRRDLKYDNE